MIILLEKGSQGMIIAFVLLLVDFGDKIIYVCYCFLIFRKLFLSNKKLNKNYLTGWIDEKLKTIY